MLLETTTKYRADTEVNAKDMIEQIRKDAEKKGYLIKKASYERKVKKAKGEVIAEVFVVTVTQTYAELWEDIV